MGFFDKVKDTARQLKGELEQRGVDLGSESDRPVIPPDSQSQSDPIERGMALGAADPRPLLTRDDVERITGRKVASEDASYSDNDVGWRFAFDGWNAGEVMVNVLHRTEPAEQWDAAEQLGNVRGLTEHQEDVAGIGDEAFTQDAQILYARKGPQVFYVYGYGPQEKKGGSEELPREQLVELARIAAARLPA
jgi:hypothetical protein